MSGHGRIGEEGLVTPVLQRLNTLDRFLPVWIVAAMALGLLLGRTVTGLDAALDSVEVADVSLPIAIGLLLMMYPVLAIDEQQLHVDPVLVAKATRVQVQQRPVGGDRRRGAHAVAGRGRCVAMRCTRLCRRASSVTATARPLAVSW